MIGSGHMSGTLKTRVSRGQPRLLKRLRNAFYALRYGAPVMISELRARHYIAAEDRWVDHGVVGRKIVTTEFINLLIDEMNASAPAHARFGDFKFHDSGTGSAVEQASDTTLQTKVETGRATGTQVDGGTTYQSVGTIAYTGTHALREHGLFSAASGADELLDRTMFDEINVNSGDSVEYTYTLTVSGS